MLIAGVGPRKDPKMTATNSKSAATNNAGNQVINKTRNTIKDSGVFVDYKSTVWMEESASGVVGIGFRVPSNIDEGSNLLAFVTLAFRGVVLDGFSYRELTSQKTGKSYRAILPPSRKYVKDGKTEYAGLVGFSQDMRSNLVSDVATAWEAFCQGGQQ
jgi:hypothetical protein